MVIEIMLYGIMMSSGTPAIQYEEPAPLYIEVDDAQYEAREEARELSNHLRAEEIRIAEEKKRAEEEAARRAAEEAAAAQRRQSYSYSSDGGGSSSGEYSPSYFRKMGVINWGGWRWTWYSQRVLPGGGLSIPGRHVDNQGYVCDGSNRICLASSDLSYGTVVSTPFGKDGCVYDSGCSHGTLDVYTDF